MFLFKRKFFLNKTEIEAIHQAIEKAETSTSGEIRIYFEPKCKKEPLERAIQLFEKLKMFNTKQRNGILLYIAYKSKHIAIYGDKGIYELLGIDYWEETIKRLAEDFKQEHYKEGIIKSILEIEIKLKKHFPYDADTDTNELLNEVIIK